MVEGLLHAGVITELARKADIDLPDGLATLTRYTGIARVGDVDAGCIQRECKCCDLSR